MTATERQMAADAIAQTAAAEARWNALRDRIRQERAGRYEAAADIADRGGDDEHTFARVDALDWVLATMDRMTATDANTAARQQETTDG